MKAALAATLWIPGRATDPGGRPLVYGELVLLGVTWLIGLGEYV